MEFNRTQTNIRYEDHLLLCCARTCLDSEKAERMKNLLQKEIDWPYLVKMALRHGLIPLLHRNLKTTQPDAVPTKILDQLRKYFLANASRNLLLNRELVRLLHLFETHGILAVPHKGPALASSIYGDVTLRQFTDLDILVKPNDIQRAGELITSIGYQPQFQLTANNLEPYLRSQNELSFTRNNGGNSRIIIELQWEIAPRYFNSQIVSQYLWKSIEHTPPNKELGFRTLPPEIELMMICIHGTKDLWTKLLWICDVAELIRSSKELNWDWVAELSHSLGSRRMLFLGLFLARDLLDASIPGVIAQQAELDPMVKRLATQVRQRLFNGSTGSSSILKNSLFHLKAREHLKDRVKYCIRLGMATTPGDWSLIKLPKSLFPLYYIIRPIRLMGKYGAGMIGRLSGGKNGWRGGLTASRSTSLKAK